MLNIIVCGYREWALEIISQIEVIPNIKIVKIIRTYEEFRDYQKELMNKTDIDFILFLGWSWFVEECITTKYLCLGIHPSDLPNYRGGSPIQHQIINGLKESKVTLMTLSSEKLDAGEVWEKEVLDLTGDNIGTVFKNMIDSSVKMLVRFFDKYPNCNPIPQTNDGSYYKRRKPDQSRLFINDFQSKSLEEIYNFIRALTDPYPNAFMEDENGNRLYFKEVKYEASESKDLRKGDMDNG